MNQIRLYTVTTTRNYAFDVTAVNMAEAVTRATEVIKDKMEPSEIKEISYRGDAFMEDNVGSVKIYFTFFTEHGYPCGIDFISLNYKDLWDCFGWERQDIYCIDLKEFTSVDFHTLHKNALEYIMNGIYYSVNDGTRTIRYHNNGIIADGYSYTYSYIGDLSNHPTPDKLTITKYIVKDGVKEKVNVDIDYIKKNY